PARQPPRRDRARLPEKPHRLRPRHRMGTPTNQQRRLTPNDQGCLRRGKFRTDTCTAARLALTFLACQREISRVSALLHGRYGAAASGRRAAHRRRHHYGGACPARTLIVRVVVPVMTELVRSEQCAIADAAHVEGDTLAPSPVAAHGVRPAAAVVDVVVAALD